MLNRSFIKHLTTFVGGVVLLLGFLSRQDYIDSKDFQLGIAICNAVIAYLIYSEPIPKKHFLIKRKNNSQN